MTITKAERAELKSVVKQQFKVLRTEIDQRKSELVADVDRQINERFAEEDQRWRNVEHETQEAVNEANRRINDALTQQGFQDPGVQYHYVGTRNVSRPTHDRNEMRRQAHHRIDSQVKQAKLKLDRDEADLLKHLAADAIESDEAREFLNSIPTVGELVPQTRVEEIEAGMEGGP